MLIKTIHEFKNLCEYDSISVHEFYRDVGIFHKHLLSTDVRIFVDLIRMYHKLNKYFVSDQTNSIFFKSM